MSEKSKAAWCKVYRKVLKRSDVPDKVSSVLTDSFGAIWFLTEDSQGCTGQGTRFKVAVDAFPAAINHSLVDVKEIW